MLLFRRPMWSGQWPGPGPAGSGLKYEIVLRAGPGHNCCGPGRASNHVCGPGLGLDFRPVQGPSRQWIGQCTLFKVVGQGDWQSKLEVDKRIAVPI